MKKTKNLCIRALCAIFVGVVLGCSGSGGESDIKNDGGNNENEQKYPDYYIDEDFGGQKFVEYGRADHYSNDEFTTCYNNAKKFMADKVEDLQNDIKGQTNSYYKMIDTALQRYNKQQTIGNNIDTNYDAFGSLFNALTSEDILGDDEYNDYRLSYYKLAYNAYQNSLSNAVENNDSQASKDMKNTNNSFFVKELANSNYNYTTFTLTKAKEVMNDTLAIISQKTKVNSTVLKKVVELVLYNESLYGLNDFAVGQGISTLHHKHNGIDEFFTYGATNVMNYSNNFNNVQNIDDGRTM